MNIGLLTSESHENACPYIRVKSPLSFLHERKVINFLHLGDLDKEPLNLSLLERLDIVVVQRGMPDILPFAHLKKLLKSNGTKIIYEIDDALTDAPESNPHFCELTELKPRIYEYLAGADMVTVSTEELKELYASFNKNIVVLPNYLDMSLWDSKDDRQILDGLNNSNELFTILISGTYTHSNDSGLIESVLSKILDENEGIRLIQFGVTYKSYENGRNGNNSSTSRVTSIPVVPGYRNYAAILKKLNVNLALIPLEDHVFNRVKSNIKWLEYSICGIPGIFSRISPYSGSIEHGKTGLLAGNSAEEWYEMIKSCISYPMQLKQIGINAYLKVKKDFSLEEHVDKWARVYAELLTEGNGFQGKRIDHTPVNNGALNDDNSKVRGALEGMGENWYRKYLSLKTSSTGYRSLCYFRLGEIAERNGNVKWKGYFKKSIAILEDKGDKKDIELYRLASSFKKIGDFERAMHYFEVMLRLPLPNHLKAGVYFHLGEILFKKADYSHAKSMFECCLVLIPFHGKSREYLMNLNQNEKL